MTTNKELEQQVNSLTENLDKVVDSTNDAIESVNAKMDEGFASIGDQFQAILKAVNNPVSISKSVEAESESHGQAGDVEWDEEHVMIPPKHLMDVEGPAFKEKEALAAFMNEKVRIKVIDDSNKDSDPNFMISVNNDSYSFFRDQEYVVPRYIVEAMARAKPIHYDNQEFLNDQGARDSRLKARIGLRYPFHTIADSEKGNDWLRGVLSEAV